MTPFVLAPGPGARRLCNREDVDLDEVMVQVRFDPEVMALEGHVSKRLVKYRLGVLAALLHRVADQSLEEVVWEEGGSKVKPEMPVCHAALRSSSVPMRKQAWDQESIWPNLTR